MTVPPAVKALAAQPRRSNYPRRATDLVLEDDIVHAINITWLRTRCNIPLGNLNDWLERSDLTSVTCLNCLAEEV